LNVNVGLEAGESVPEYRRGDEYEVPMPAVVAAAIKQRE